MSKILRIGILRRAWLAQIRRREDIRESRVVVKDGFCAPPGIPGNGVGCQPRSRGSMASALSRSMARSASASSPQPARPRTCSSEVRKG